MADIKVLLVEDEATLAMIIKDTLSEEGLEIELAGDGEEGLQRFHEFHPDVLVCDIMMPRMDGFEMVRRIRRSDQRTPIIFLTARSQIKDVVEGFELGANDYLRKPFNMQELLIRVKAAVGRAAIEYPNTEEHPQWLTIGHYRLHPKRQQLVYLSPTDDINETTDLSYRETEILHRLVINRGEILSTQQLLLDLWGDDSFYNTRSLHVFITKLRHKLEKDQRIRIINVRGVGYKLIYPFTA